jgi:hypothetical protein
MGREVVTAITNGRLDFGTWERIFYGERVLVKIIVAAGLLCGLRQSLWRSHSHECAPPLKLLPI